MKGFENTITIERPLDEVFRFVSDQCNNPKWNYFVMQVEKLNSISGAGAEYLQTRKTDQQRFIIKEYKANRQVMIETLPGERPAVTRKIWFEGDANRTLIRDQITFKLPIPTFLARLVLKRPKKAVKENLEKLKILLESGQVVLQDGRNSFYR